MLTAKSQDTDKVLGLEFGADDYLTKPFGIPEFLARVRALLRRTDLRTDKVERVSIAGLEMDFTQQCIRGKKGIEALSTHENGILRILVAFKGEPVSRGKILETVWDGMGATDRTVDFHVVNLRKKIETVTGLREPHRILTAHGTGYKFVG